MLSLKDIQNLFDASFTYENAFGEEGVESCNRLLYLIKRIADSIAMGKQILYRGLRIPLEMIQMGASTTFNDNYDLINECVIQPNLEE